MNRKILFNSLQYFINVATIVAIITLLIIFKIDVLGYYITLWILMGVSILNIILVGFKEYFIKEYSSLKFTLVLHATYCVLNCGAYYLVKYVGGYEKFFYLYWLLSYLGTAIIIGVFVFLNYRFKDDKPKFKVNNNA